MRFMPEILAKLFKPVPLVPDDDDPVGRELGEAVEAHERQAADTCANIDHLRGAIDDVLARLDQAR